MADNVFVSPYNAYVDLLLIAAWISTSYEDADNLSSHVGVIYQYQWVANTEGIGW